MIETKKQLKSKKGRKESVASPLAQRIDFTEWLRGNPNMRPKRKKTHVKK